METGLSQLNFWEELPCGIYSIKIDASSSDVRLAGGIKKHGWSNSILQQLIQWERHYVEPRGYDGENQEIKSPVVPTGPCLSGFSYRREPMNLVGFIGIGVGNSNALFLNQFIGPPKASVSRPAEIVLMALRDSVMRRTSLHTIFQVQYNSSAYLSVICYSIW